MKTVYVITIYDEADICRPYIYGIFDSEEYAWTHYNANGDKRGTRAILTSEQYITKPKK